MSFMNFLEQLILHVSHSLVDRILANGAGGPGSNPGGVTWWHSRGRTMETLGHVWCDKMWGGSRINLIICSQKCHFNLLKFE